MYAAEEDTAHQNPEQNQPPNHQAPGPAPGGEHAARRQGPVVDHNRRPAHQLEDVQHGEQKSALLSKAHLHGLHGTSPAPPADEARQEEQNTANHMAGDDGGKALGEPQRGEAGTGENLRQGDPGPEPNEAVLKRGGFFHVPASPSMKRLWRSHMWSMGPEPCPRSSCADRAPKM